VSRPDEIMSAVERLAWLVTYAEANEERGQPWQRYLKQVRHDAADLLRSPELPVLLARLKSAGTRHWAEAANTLERAIKGVAKLDAEHKQARLRVVRRDEAPPDPRERAVWAMLDKIGTGDKQRAATTLLNVVRVLQHDTRWTGRIRYNEFAGSPELDKREACDADPVAMAVWLAENYWLNVSPRTCTEALGHVAHTNPYHPVRDYLRGLKWDGERRLHRLLNGYMHAATLHEGHRDLVTLLGVRWMTAAVARVMRPGCQVKSALVLIGDQDAGKSKALRILGGEWYTKTKLDVRGKDGMVQVQGVWIYEIAEIRALFASRSAEEIKAFLDQDDDRFRRTWGTYASRHPRQVVFAGTDNTAQLFADPTGSSRYWPVSVSDIDFDALTADRDQLWAEATFLFDRGDRWHLDKTESALMAEINAEYQEIDPWTWAVRSWMGKREHRQPHYSIGEILEGIGLVPRDQTPAAAHRLAGVLRNMGAVNVRKNAGSAKVHVWKVDP
jgi:hypothetical protein